VRRLTEAMVTLDEPGREASPVLARLTEILRAPADPRAIAPYLDAPDTSAKLYALWRLEQLHCQGNRHLVDGYLVRVLRKSMNVDWLARERRASPCRSVREGYWPSRGMVQEALAAGRLYWEADPVHQGFYTQPIPGFSPEGEGTAREMMR
jgi:hypothetical protein